MARVAVTPITPSRAGVAAATPLACDATNFNTVANDGQTIVLAKNTGAGARTIDFIIKRTVDGVTPDRAAISIAAGATRVFGPFPINDYSAALDFNAEHAEVEVSAYRVP